MIEIKKEKQIHGLYKLAVAIGWRMSFMQL